MLTINPRVNPTYDILFQNMYKRMNLYNIVTLSFSCVFITKKFSNIH